MMKMSLRSVYLMVTVLHVLAFSTIQCKIDVEREKRELSKDDSVRYAGEFLIGEQTPVWTVRNDDPNEVPVKISLTVKKSIDIFKRYNPQVIPKNINGWDIGIPSSQENLPKDEVYHPSILIVVAYKKEHAYFAAPEDKINYAVAFWNGIDLQLRRITNPKIRLRISGIVIVDPERERRDITFRYLVRDPSIDDEERMMDRQFDSMMKYWRNTTKFNDDFRNGTFDIVATMTDHHHDGVLRVKSSDGPLCSGSDGVNISGLLIHDDQRFRGLQRTVQELAKMLGAKKVGGCTAPSYNVMTENIPWIGRKWSECTLDQISTTLTEKGSCLREAKEIHPPGYPAETLLPGQLVEKWKQCRTNIRGYSDVCTRTSCEWLYCKTGLFDWWCPTYTAITLDGSECEEGKLCLDGKCVCEPDSPYCYGN